MADKSTIILRRVRKPRSGGHGNAHGGAWKVAYADFVTAMMAFFLVLWLIGTTSTKQRAAISEYFRNPSPLTGTSQAPAPGMNGPGGASNSMIKLGGTLEIPHGPGSEFTRDPSPAQSQQAQRQQDHQRLEALMQQLHEAISKSQALEPFKDQLLLDLTPDGLRIQIVDKQNRPMFDLGSARLKDYTQAILHELAKFINEVPNHISITGHTDTTTYSTVAGYSNWELSADRSNAARRALVSGGMQDSKVARVVGLGSSVLFDKVDPQNPINRRISIVVMTHDAEQAALTGSTQGLALGPRLPDADTQVPNLAPATSPHAAATEATPANTMRMSGAHAATSTAGQVSAAAALARAAETAAHAYTRTPAQP